MHGNANKIKGFMGMIKPFGIIDMARTGVSPSNAASLRKTDRFFGIPFLRAIHPSWVVALFWKFVKL